MNCLVSFVWGNKMRNNVYIKALWIIDDNGSYLEFVFSNPEEKYLGNVDITDKGKISWDIADLNYLDNIMELINFVMEENCYNKFHYESKDENINRWNNACMYLQLRNIIVNKKYNFASNMKIIKGNTR